MGHVRLPARREDGNASSTRVISRSVALLPSMAGTSAASVVIQGHKDRDIHEHWDTLNAVDLDYYQVAVGGSITPFPQDSHHLAQQSAMRRQPLPVALALDDDLVAGVGQAVQGAPDQEPHHNSGLAPTPAAESATPTQAIPINPGGWKQPCLQPWL